MQKGSARNFPQRSSSVIEMLVQFTVNHRTCHPFMFQAPNWQMDNLRSNIQAWILLVILNGTPMVGPRGMDTLGPVPESLILHHSWAKGVSQWLFMPFIALLDPNGNILKFWGFQDNIFLVYLGLVAEQTLWGDQKTWLAGNCQIK